MKYIKILCIFVGGVYAPYAPCVATLLSNVLAIVHGYRLGNTCPKTQRRIAFPVILRHMNRRAIDVSHRFTNNNHSDTCSFINTSTSSALNIYLIVTENFLNNREFIYKSEVASRIFVSVKPVAHGEIKLK